jgi:hypothetical protein
MNMHPNITAAVERERTADMTRESRRSRLARQARRVASPRRTPEPISIRRAAAADGPAIAQIAELESKPVPTGRPLVAITGGRVAAVVDPESGAVLADPFLPTEHVVRAVRAYIADDLASAA